MKKMPLWLVKTWRFPLMVKRRVIPAGHTYLSENVTEEKKNNPVSINGFLKQEAS